MKQTLCLLIIVLLSNIVKAQEKDFSIYVFKNLYDFKGKKYIESNPKIKNIEIFGKNVIYPSGKDTINLENLKRKLENKYPDTKSDGILCLNIENKIYDDLKNHKLGEKEFLNAEQKLIEMIDLVKNLRPNLKIGIYGIPFRTYYNSQLVWNEKEKFNKLLSQTDVIFPSLYILYPDKQLGKEANDNYWSQNLETSLEYGQQLNKEVIPFIWYMVHDSNKKHHGEILDRNAMKRYLNYIKNYSSKNNCSISGIVWWDFSKSTFKKSVRLSVKQKNDSKMLDRNYILKEYTNLIN